MATRHRNSSALLVAAIVGVLLSGCIPTPTPPPPATNTPEATFTDLPPGQLTWLESPLDNSTVVDDTKPFHIVGNSAIPVQKAELLIKLITGQTSQTLDTMILTDISTMQTDKGTIYVIQGDWILPVPDAALAGTKITYELRLRVNSRTTSRTVRLNRNVSTLTPTSTATKTNTNTPTPTSTSSATRTTTPTPTASATLTLTTTPTASDTDTPTFTSTPTPSNTDTPTLTPSNTGTPTSTPSNTKTQTLTATATASPSLTPTPTSSRTPTSTPTFTYTLTSTPTPTPSRTPTATFTNTATATRSFTPTFTPSYTKTPTPTSTPSLAPCSVFVSAGQPAANVRTGPGTLYPLMGGISPADGRFLVTGVNIDGHGNKWWQINYNGAAGWVSDPFVTTSGDCSNVPPVAAPPLPVTRTFTPNPCQINYFYADTTTLNPGQCTTLHWDIQGVTKVTLNGNGVVGVSTMQICVVQKYTLTLFCKDGTIKYGVVDVGAPPSPYFWKSINLSGSTQQQCDINGSSVTVAVASTGGQPVSGIPVTFTITDPDPSGAFFLASGTKTFSTVTDTAGGAVAGPIVGGCAFGYQYAVVVTSPVVPGSISTVPLTNIP